MKLFISNAQNIRLKHVLGIFSPRIKDFLENHKYFVHDVRAAHSKIDN